MMVFNNIFWSKPGLKWLHRTHEWDEWDMRNYFICSATTLLLGKDAILFYFLFYERLKEAIWSVTGLLSSLASGSSTTPPPMQCFTGNCTTYEECRDLSLIADCPDDQAYDACLTYVDQKGKNFAIKTFSRQEQML